MAYINPPNTVFAGAGLIQNPAPCLGNNGATAVTLSMINPAGFASYYGSFYDTTTQPNVVNTANIVSLNSTSSAFGISIVDGSKITFQHTGVYNIQISAQFSKLTGAEHDADLWFILNGSNIPHSNSQITLFGSNSKCLLALNFMFSVVAGDQIQIAWSSSFASMLLLSQPPQINPLRPEIPSAVVTVQLVKEP